MPGVPSPSDSADPRPISALGELEVIALCADALGPAAQVPPGWTGIGDDAAVTTSRPGEQLVTTTDLLVEGVHFRRSTISPRDLGWKALAVNVSDVAAMGAVPRWATVSIALPGDVQAAWLAELYRGVADLCAAHGGLVVGGDTVGSPGPVVLAVTVVGGTIRPLLRSSAVAGALLVATGPLGGSAAGLHLLEHPEAAQRVAPADAAAVRRSHRRPVPHVAAGRALAALAPPPALMDDSDGLARSALTLAQASGLEAVLEGNRLPVDPAAGRVATALGLDGREWALHGGEDYVLVAAIAPETLEAARTALEGAGAACHVVGRLEAPGRGHRLVADDGAEGPLLAGDFAHFPGVGPSTPAASDA